MNEQKKKEEEIKKIVNKTNIKKIKKKTNIGIIS